MFDSNPLNNVPEQIKNMYAEASKAASDGAMDAFKDLPKKMQEALDADGLSDMIASWGKLSDKVKIAQRQIEQQGKKMKTLIDLTEQLNAALQRQAISELNAAKASRDRAKTLQTHMKRQAELDSMTMAWNTKLKSSATILNSMKASYNGLTGAQTLLNAHMGKGNALGNIFKQGWGGVLNTIRNIGMTGATFMTGLTLGMRIFIKQLGEAYQISRNMGYGVGASFGNMGTGVSDFIKNLMEFRLTNVRQAVEYRNLMSREFGTRDMPNGVMEAGNDMMAYYRMTSQEATKVSAALYRNNRFNARASEQDYLRIQGIAKRNNIGPGELLREIAQNGNLYATYAERGTLAFAKAAVEVRKIGLSMASVSGFADRMVNDFESSLMMQAKIQTIMPGADFSEVMYASQFGTEGDIAAALKGSLGGRNIMSMPRSLRNMISSSTGLSMEELRNIDRGSSPESGDYKDGSAADGKKNALDQAFGTFDTNLWKAVGAVIAFTVALGTSTGRLAMNAASGAMRGGVGAAARFAGRGLGAAAIGMPIAQVGYAAYNAPVGGRTAAAGKAVSQNAGALLGSTLGGIIGSIFPGIGTLLGAGVGGAMGGGIDYLRSNVKHSGGMVGQGTTRNIHSSVFAGAPRYHNGLMPDEVPSILQKGEAVLSRIQLAGLTKLMDAMQSMGKIGEKLTSLKTEGIAKFGSTIADMISGKGTGASGLLGRGISMLTGGGASGGVSGAISGLLGKVTGGSGLQGLAGKALGGITSKLGGAKIGAMIGSIIPGAGTLVGGLLGSAITKIPGVSKVMGAVSGVAGKAIGGIGKLFGFGKKKKAAPATTPTQMTTGVDASYLNESASAYVDSGTGQMIFDAGMPASGAKTDGSRVEALLEQLIAATREGKEIYLDAKKVGTTVVNSFGRE